MITNRPEWSNREMKAMNNKYDHIDMDNGKVNRIVQVGFEEFSKYGIKKASLNNILKIAGVPKGVFYHYFKDKKELLDFLIYQSIVVSGDYMNENIDWNNKDYLYRLLQGVRAKLELQYKHPFIMDFYKTIILNGEDKHIYEVFEQLYPDLRDKFYNADFDFSNVKDGIDIEKMKMVVNSTIRCLGEQEKERMRQKDYKLDMEIVVKTCEEYLEFFRGLFYK